MRILERYLSVGVGYTRLNLKKAQRYAYLPTPLHTLDELRQELR